MFDKKIFEALEADFQDS